MRVFVLVLALLGAGSAAAEDDAFDFEGLPPGPGQEETYYNCVACHSMKLVTQQRLTRESWDEVLDWMVDEQEMEPMEPELRTTVLDYLAAHYGWTEGGAD